MINAVPITTCEGHQHLVPEYAVAEWRDVGVYPARCGAWVTAAAMTEPVRTRCYLCLLGQAT
jgi:hypothetical protein